MMITSSVYVHLQRPDNGEWVTVGRYTLKLVESVNESAQGFFQYAPSYIDSGLKWIIDPINMPRLDVEPYFASRYGGLSDVLRDISPDAWGKLLIQRAFNLPARAHEYEFLMKSSNADRWGALTVSKTRNPNPDTASSPRLSKLEDLLIELGLMAEQKPSKYPELRNRLTKTPSLGGARPKATVQDGDVYWLVKPTIQTDVSNTALLEYVAMRWAKASGLNVAECNLYQDDVRTAVLVKRFDRVGMQRHMVLSGATLLQTEYPANSASGQNQVRWSYPLLAQALRRIGVPELDLNELFGRMIFNAVCGNDDDHPRNHAAIWNQEESRWRLSPAFDIVPNIEFKPTNLAMQLSDGRWDISRQSLMADWKFFGFKSIDDVNQYKATLLDKILFHSRVLTEMGASMRIENILNERVLQSIKTL
jgi:serine/threonine-protein kinase HipA